MKTILVIGGSLNPGSRSQALATAAIESFAKREDVRCEFVDLRQTELPLCDGAAAYGHPNTQALQKLGAEADAVLLTTPIYNYDVNAAVKNLVELTGRSWSEKPVGFLCAAGGKGSYMALMGLANSLTLDFHCLIVPRFVYTVGTDFEDGRVSSPEVLRRIDQLCALTLRCCDLQIADLNDGE